MAEGAKAVATWIGMIQDSPKHARFPWEPMGQMMVTLFEDGTVHAAFRLSEWESWGPPWVLDERPVSARGVGSSAESEAT